MVRVEKNPRLGSPVEVSDKPERRKFTADYKLRILKAVDACETGRGELGELLRREGLYASHLTTWRKQRDEGSLAALEPKKRGRKAKQRNRVSIEMEQLERENARLQLRLRQAEAIIDVQKKLSIVLGLSLPTNSNENGRSE